MNIIIKKVKVVPHPMYRQGTRLTAVISEPETEFGTWMTSLAPGHAAGMVDWGDGVIEPLYGNNTHIYVQPGTYQVVISDDFAVLGFGPCSKFLTSVISNAQNLVELPSSAFSGGVQLAELDLRLTRINKIGPFAFTNCTALTGEFYFPEVRVFSGPAKVMAPFKNCTGITKLHFAAKHKKSITSCAIYKADPTLGTITGECVFDL